MCPHLETLELDPEQTATASVIWMHGLGADAHDFYAVPPQLELPANLSVRYVFPNAPKIAIAVNRGAIMRAWYDLSGFDPSNQDARRLRQSAGWIHELITREIKRGIPASRIVLAGFSQGGALALFAGLRCPEILAGFICLSGYLPLDGDLEKYTKSSRDHPRIFQAHGTGDTVVPHAVGRDGCDRLIGAGYEVDWREYPIAHEVCLEELRDLGVWLAQVLGARTYTRR